MLVSFPPPRPQPPFDGDELSMITLVARGCQWTHLLFYVLSNILQRHIIGEVPLQSLQALLSFQQALECIEQVVVGTIDAMHTRRKTFVVARLSLLPPTCPLPGHSHIPSYAPSGVGTRREGGRKSPQSELPNAHVRYVRCILWYNRRVAHTATQVQKHIYPPTTRTWSCMTTSHLPIKHLCSKMLQATQHLCSKIASTHQTF